MEKLGNGAFQDTAAVVKELTALTDEPAGLRRGRRIAHLMVTTVPLAFAGLLMLALYRSGRQADAAKLGHG